MLIKDRLQMVMKMNNLTNASFADKVGVQRSSISHIMAGRNKPSLDFIQKTLNAFPRVNAQWLITGKQEKMNKPESTDESSITRSEKVDEDLKKSKEPVYSERKIDRIVVFYSDGTFVETIPEEPKT